MYIRGLKDITGNGTFEDEVVLEGKDYLGHRLFGFFHRNYMFDGALEVEVSEDELFHAMLYLNDSRLGVNVVPCGGGFIGRSREIQVYISSLCYRVDNKARRGLEYIRLEQEDSEKK